MNGALRRYAAATWTPPFSHPLPSNAARYSSSVSLWRVARRRALREFHLWCMAQGALLRTRIDTDAHRRILWIHQGTPQVGDSLMDLAARVLLQPLVERIDLLTEPHLLALYRADEVFTHVASSARKLPGPYDLILLHSTSSRSVADKLSHYRVTPFAHVQGFYTGPEFNRTLFSFLRLAHLLQLPLDAAALNLLARPSMWHSPEEEAAARQVQLPPGAIAVALGGVRDWRTYSHWPQVLRGLCDARMPGPVVLIGSDNGMAMRDRIIAANTGMPLIDCVGRHSLGEVHALMQRCSLLICADGGLLHVAQSTDVPVVALFAGIVEPDFRVTKANRTLSLHGAQTVDDVPASDVVSSVLEALAQPANPSARR